MGTAVRIWEAKRSLKGRLSHLRLSNLLALGAFPNDVPARGCVMGTELMIQIIHSLGWGAITRGR